MGKSTETQRGLVVVRAWAWEGGRETGRNGECLLNAYRAPFGVMKMLWSWTEVPLAQHCECTEWYTLKWIILSSRNSNSTENVYPNISVLKHASARSGRE